MKLFSLIGNISTPTKNRQKKIKLSRSDSSTFHFSFFTFHFFSARSCFACLLFLTPLLGFSYSQTSYFCTNTNNYVNLGDSIDQVTKNCGNPTQTKTWNSVNSENIPVEQWLYQAPMVIYPGKAKFVRPNFRIPLIINFNNDKVIRIYSEENEAQESYFCNPTIPIKIGDTKDDVRSLCSTPTVIENTFQQSKKDVATQLVYIYQPNSYDRPVSMYFENFKLVKIETE